MDSKETELKKFVFYIFSVVLAFTFGFIFCYLNNPRRTPEIHILEQDLVITYPKGESENRVPAGSHIYYHKTFPEGFHTYYIYFNLDGKKLDNTLDSQDPFPIFPITLERLN